MLGPLWNRLIVQIAATLADSVVEVLRLRLR
jgi:hypothetical protein